MIACHTCGAWTHTGACFQCAMAPVTPEPKHRADVPVDACRGICGDKTCNAIDGYYRYEFTPRHRAEDAA